MDEKIIYINSNEEITSVIDRLVKTKAEEVFFVVPKAAVISQSLINLKLLKREADNLRKRIIFVSSDAALQRLAKKIGFSVSESLPGQLEQEEPKSQSEEVLQEQVTPEEFKRFLKEEKKSSSFRMTDIVRTGTASPGRIAAKKIKDISSKSADLLLKQREEESKILAEQPTAQEEKIPVKENFEIKSYQKQDFVERPPALPFEREKQVRGETNAVSSFPVKIFGIFIFCSIVIAGLVFYLVLPKAEILISAKKEQIPFDFMILADKNLSQIDTAANKIPAQLMKLEDKDTQEFPATGQRQLNEKAKGTITIYNAYSSSPQALVETTRFLSQEGKIFRLTKSVTIPGAKIEEGKIVASSIDVEVEADQPGKEYNIGPSNFSIPGFQGSPKYAAFYGKSKSSMSGGSTENIKILTQDDFNKAKDKVWDGLRQKIQTELAVQISADLKILDGAVAIAMSEAKSSVEIGGKAETFTLVVTGTAKALVFSEADVSKLLANNLSAQLGGNKEITSQTPLNYKDIKIDIEKGQMNFRLAGLQEAVWKINEDEIKKVVAGKQQSEVRDILSQRPEIKEAQFSLWPFWARSIPKQIDKIKITVD